MSDSCCSSVLQKVCYLRKTSGMKSIISMMKPIDILLAGTLTLMLILSWWSVGFLVFMS